MQINIKRVSWIVTLTLLALAIRIIFEYAYDLFDESYTYSQFISISLRYFLFAMVVLIWISIVASSEHHVNKLPWLIILALEPFIGLTLFLSFGRSFRRSERYKELPLLKPKAYLTKEPVTDMNREVYQKIDSEITDIYRAAYNSTGHHPYVNDSSAKVLTDGNEYFPVLLEKLQNAQSFILMQFYIIRTDEIGKQVLNILKEKASSGIDVKLLYDAFGSVFLSKQMLKSLKQHGVEIVVNDPVYFGLFNTRLNYRNHRKITVIDGEYGFLGGHNLGDEYNQKNKKFGHWRDTSILLQGRVVKSLTQLFFRDYYYNTDHFISDLKYYPTTTKMEEGMVQVIPSGPEFVHPPIRNVYVKMINNAKESIKIMTPYLALDQELLTSLVIAVKSGVKVSIIIPGIPDKKSIYTVTKSFVEGLIEEGIDIYMYSPGFCHAKVFIIDDMLASCGTYNFDNRSAKINFEVTALLYQQGVDKLIEDFNHDLLQSKRIEPKRWRKRGLINRIYEGLLNLFSPLV